MKSIVSFTLDVNKLRELKSSCDRLRVSASSYIEYALEVAPPLDEQLAQFLTARRKGNTPAV